MTSGQSLLKRIAGYVERNTLLNAFISGIGSVLDTMRTAVTNLTDARESPALLTRRAQDRMIYFGGWETTQEQTTYLRTWQAVLEARGSRNGVQAELDRLVKGASGDAGVTITDMNDSDVGIMTDGQYPDAAGAYLDAKHAILISGTNNSLIRSEQEIESLMIHHLTSVAIIPIFNWS